MRTELLKLLTFLTILLFSLPYIRSREPQFLTWGWSICSIFWDASCLPTLLFLPSVRHTQAVSVSQASGNAQTVRPYLHQPRTVCFPHVITYSLFWFLPGITSNLMLVSPIPWFLGGIKWASIQSRFKIDERSESRDETSGPCWEPLTF